MSRKCTSILRGDRTVTIVARKVHRELGLENRMPAVCGALDARAFLDVARVTGVTRYGPRFGATASWRLDLAQD